MFDLCLISDSQSPGGPSNRPFLILAAPPDPAEFKGDTNGSANA
jgi:hypothetical protein